MHAGKGKSTKYAYLFRRMTGVPLDADLGPWRCLVDEARAGQPAAAGARELLAMAEALGREMGAAGRDSKAGPELARCLGLGLATCRLFLGFEAYDEQLIAAAALCSGRVAQVQTGEGKTLAIALAALYCAKRDGGVHVITANEYLARRDAEWMGPFFRALGLSVASLSGAAGKAERRAAYRADVLYLTARELGFDYLRDGLARRPEDLVQGPFRSAIVDEADFILIDEARVPLVIAGLDAEDEAPAGEAHAAHAAVQALASGVDYRVDPEGRKVSFTLEGRARLEALLSCPGFHEASSSRLFARAHAALHAQRLLERDRDYVVASGGIRLVDSFTGRIAGERQWPWGIQAALEVKEGLEPGPEGRIYASIAVQHLIGLYPRLAATTATAETAAEELHEAYGLRTLVIPPVRPSRRQDGADLVFRDKDAKLRAIVHEIEQEGGMGRPILVGTASIRESEELAALLSERKIPAVLLNAKNDEAEAGLIARAGETGALTISTNMAGRGTDIRLGADGKAARLGGLYVIGANKHESRRVDDQLRGRAGRQGDPGQTRFFISLEDEIFERYGVASFLPPSCLKGPVRADGLIEDPRAGREINRAQAIIEGQNSRERAQLRKYSLLVEYDRRYVRELRDAALVEGRLPPPAEEELALAGEAGKPGLRAQAVQAFLARLDAAWADHLALVEDVKEGLSLQRYGGRDPGIEFLRSLAQAFEGMMAAVIEASAGDCRSLGESGGREAPPGLPARPASTWTYAVEADALPGFELGLGGMAGALALGPLALPWLILARLGKALGRGGGKGSPR